MNAQHLNSNVNNSLPGSQHEHFDNNNENNNNNNNDHNRTNSSEIIDILKPLSVL